MTGRDGDTFGGCGMIRAACVAMACLGAAPLACPPPALAADEGRPDVLSVSVTRARSLCFEDRVEVTGILVPRQQADVGPEREGFKVTQVLAGPLDEVTAGQVLARLQPVDGGSGAATSVAIRSPVSGTVLRSSAVVGVPASARLGPLFQIVVGGDVDLQADVPLPDLRKLATGQDVTVRPLGLPEMAAKVLRVEDHADATSQLGRVRIGLFAGGEVRIGTFARGVVVVARRCGVGVPYSAVTYETDATIVQVVSGGRIETRQVEVGLLSGGNAEIRSGLSEADSVVVRAGPFLREGDPVKPIAVKAE